MSSQATELVAEELMLVPAAFPRDGDDSARNRVAIKTAETATQNIIFTAFIPFRDRIRLLGVSVAIQTTLLLWYSFDLVSLKSFNLQVFNGIHDFNYITNMRVCPAVPPAGGPGKFN